MCLSESVIDCTEHTAVQLNAFRRIRSHGLNETVDDLKVSHMKGNSHWSERESV